VQIRPRVPHSRRIQVCLENTSLKWARFSFVTDKETLVNEKGTTILWGIAGPDPASHGASPRVERVSMGHQFIAGGDEADQCID
jgi:hypothetical protein